MIDMQRILTYLINLEAHNNREWYHAHKQERLLALQDFEELVEVLILKIQEFDPSIPMHDPKNLMFKLVRDTRFGKDKTPYLPAFRAHIGPKGKLPIPVGYYISIAPHDQSFLGGGLFAAMFKDATDRVRDYIVDHSDQFNEILQNAAFAKAFTVQGTCLKNVPKGYDAQHPMATYLRYKNWYLEYFLQDQVLVKDAEWIAMAVKRFEQMMPFHAFLNQALQGFVFPERKK